MRLLTLAILVLSTPLLAAEGDVVNVYSRPQWMSAEILELFTRESGVRINYSVYDNDEDLYGGLIGSHSRDYDLVIPSSAFVDRMRHEDLLLKLDRSRLPNFKNLDPNLLNKPYDPDNEFSVPHLWGTIGLGYDSTLIQPGTLTRYKELWDARYKGRVLLVDNMRDVFGMGLRVLGYSINDSDEKHIHDAYQLLKELMPNVKVFNAESPRAFFLEGEVTAGLVWNREICRANQDNPDIRYLFPAEGVGLWMASLVIPRDARNSDGAYRLIEFLLRPDVAAMLSQRLCTATANKAALPLLPKEFRDLRMVYPTADDIRNSELPLDLGAPQIYYERYWELLRAGRN